MRRLAPLKDRNTQLLLAFLVGLFTLWFIELFIHIPGTMTATAPSSYVPYSNSGNSQSNAPKVGSTESNQSNSLPSVIPVYTPSTVTASADKKEVLASPSSVDTVVNFYGEELSTGGWKITTESTENGTTTINAAGNGYAISVSITGEGSNQSQFTIQTS